MNVLQKLGLCRGGRILEDRDLLAIPKSTIVLTCRRTVGNEAYLIVRRRCGQWLS
jgi:hypothetical protein